MFKASLLRLYSLHIIRHRGNKRWYGTPIFDRPIDVKSASRDIRNPPIPSLKYFRIYMYNLALAVADRFVVFGWRSSREIRDSINNFTLWSLTFMVQ